MISLSVEFFLVLESTTCVLVPVGVIKKDMIVAALASDCPNEGFFLFLKSLLSLMSLDPCRI